MFKKLKIAEKLALIFIGFTLVVTIFLTASYYLNFERAITARVFLQLSSIKQLKKTKILNELNDHLHAFQYIRHDSLLTIENNFVYTALTTHFPDSIMGYDLPEEMEATDNVKVVDLTGQKVEKGIMLAFVAKHQDMVLTTITQLPEVQEILLERTGLGETGESYLVNANHHLITKSRFDSIESKNIEVKTRGVLRAFEGNPGSDIFMDYRDIRVLGAFEKIEFHGLQWVLMSEINYNEAMEPLQKLRTNLFYIFLIIIFFILIVSFYLSRILVSPILAMEKQLINLSKGILDHEAFDINQEDEIGQMFYAYNQLIETLKRMVVFAGEIGSGNFRATYYPLSDEDKLGEALLKMKEQLQEYEANEFRLIRENQLSIIEGQEKERSRLSKELHDGLGPFLTTLRMQIQSIDFDKNVKGRLLNQIDDIINEVRRISNNLMPSVLEDFGVGEAIDNLLAQLSTSKTISIRYSNDMKAESGVGKPIQIALYRVVQEAINNALKHSSCSEIKISISEFDEYIGLFISDNGVGFNIHSPFSGNGIRNMKERVKLVGGNFEITSNDTGTTIDIEIPLNEHH